jgi:hypothetical protein
MKHGAGPGRKNKNRIKVTDILSKELYRADIGKSP